MADQQIVTENGRVSLLFKNLLSIAAALSTAGILAIFAIAWNLKDSIHQLDKSLGVAISRMEAKESIDARQDNDIATLGNRVTELERRERSAANRNNP